MKKLKRILSFVLCLVMIVTVIQIASQNVYAAKKIKLNKTKLTMYVGEKEYLHLYEGKYWTSAKWSSSNKKVATVNSKGQIKALKSGTAKITAKYNNKKYVCKLTVKDALKDHVSYEIIDVPENKYLYIKNNIKAIKVTNDNDIAIAVDINCKYYDKDGFYLNDDTDYCVINKNSYIIMPVRCYDYTKISLKNIYKTNPINIEYSISDPYIEKSYEYRDIILYNKSKFNKNINYSIIYYNSNDEIIAAYNSQKNVPAGEKTKITYSDSLKNKEQCDIQKNEVYVY